MKQFESIEAVMERALELAREGRGSVEPNPMVGAVIVDDDLNLVSEGYHQRYGGPHAEIEALSKIDFQAEGKTLVVTLEPCCHQGKTGPCSTAVVQAGIRKVCIGIQDPAPHVDGGGIKELEKAGIEVQTGILEDSVRELMAPFIQLTQTGLPRLHAKWAMTLDGKIASRTGHSQWISNEKSREVVHQLRGVMDGILVGSETALKDDPMLTARPKGPRVATRIVIDRDGLLPAESKLVQTANEVPLLLVTGPDADPAHVELLEKLEVETLMIPFEKDSNKHLDLVYLLKELGKREMTNILVEGGGGISGSFFDQKLINEVHVFVAGKIVGGKDAISPVAGKGLENIPEFSQLIHPDIRILDHDVYIHGSLAPKRV